MPRVGEGQVQVNFVLPEELDRKVKSYQHRHELSSKSEAYRALIEQALQQEENAPKG